MKRLLLTAALTAGVMAGPAVAETINLGGSTNVEFTREVDRQIAPGVQYLYLKAPGRGTYGTHVFLTIADLTDPTVSVEYYTANGTTGGETKSLSAIASANTTEGHRVIAGANANFWITSEQPWKSQMTMQPHGTAIHDGETYVQNAIDGYGSHIGGPVQTGMIAFTQDGRMKINYYTPKLEVTNTRIGHVMDIKDFNRTVTSGTAVIYTPAWGRTKAFKPVTLNSSGTWNIVENQCTEIMLSLAPGETGMKVGGTTKYIIKEIRTNAGTGTLGNYDLAIVGQNSYATVTATNWRVGDEIVLNNTFSTDGNQWPLIEEATSGNCMAMVAGRVIGATDGPIDQSNYNNNIYARTLYGTNDDGTKLYIAVCGNKTGTYYGMTTVQMANLLKHFGATYASQVDCGGSSQMYVDGSQVNKSTDGSNVRTVHSGMFIVSSAAEEVLPVSVTVSPAENAYFGELNIGGSASKTYSVNAQNLHGDITISITGANANQFSLSNNTILKANAKGDFAVMYRPSEAGDHTATLNISTPDHAPITYTLGGTGTMKAGADAIYQDDPQAFGYVAPGSYEMEVEYTDRAIPQLADHVIKRVIARGDVLYILGHKGNDATIVVFDHVNGRVLRTLGTTANTIGTKGISDIAISADGWLMAINYATQGYGGTGNVMEYVYARDAEGFAQGDPLPANVTNYGGNYTNAYTGETFTLTGTRASSWMYYTATTTASSGATRVQCMEIQDSQFKGKAYHNNTNGFLTRPAYGEFLMFASPYADNEYIINGSKVNAKLIPRVDASAGVPTIKAEVPTNVIPANALHTGIFRFGGKIYMTSPSFANSTVNNGILLVDITDGIAQAKQVPVSGTAMSDYNNINVATTGMGIAVMDEGQYVESRMALFAVRNGAVTKFITPSTVTIDPGELPEIITTLQDVDFGELEVGESAVRSFSIEGVNLQGDIELMLNGSSDFKLSQTSISAEEGNGNISITYTPSLRGESTATLILSTRGMRSMEFTLKGKGAGEFGLRAYAYGLKVQEQDNRYDYTFSLNANAPGVTLVLKGENGQTYSYPQGRMEAGTHTLSVPFTLIAPDKYTWEVQVDNQGERTGDKFFHEAPGTLDARGGVVVIKDVENEAFGTIVTSAGYAQGFTIYNGDLTKRGTYLAGNSNWTNTNRSSLYRLAYRASDGCIYGNDYADKGAGIYVFNPIHPEYGTGNIFAPNGATKDSGGCWTYNGVKLGGGNSGLCFTGTGADTKLWSYQEDYPAGNTKPYLITVHNIGTGTHVTTAPTKPNEEQFNSNKLFASQNVSLYPSKHGVFMAQGRGAGNNSTGCPGFILSDLDGTVLYNSGGNPDIPSCAGSVAINHEENLLAVSLYGGIIRLFDVTWNGNKPTLTMRGDVTGSYNDLNETCQMDFDYAGNLYVFYRSTKAEYDGLNVFVLPYEAGTVTTPSPAAQAFDATETCAEKTEMVTLTHQAQINLEGTYALATATGILNENAQFSPLEGNVVSSTAKAAELTITEQPGGVFTIGSQAGYLSAGAEGLSWKETADDNALFEISINAEGKATVTTKSGNALLAGESLRLLATEVRPVVEISTLAQAAEAAEGSVIVMTAEVNVLHAAPAVDGQKFDVFFTDGATIAAAHMPLNQFSTMLDNHSVAHGVMLVANTAADNDAYAYCVLNGNCRGFAPVADTHEMEAEAAYIHTAQAENGLKHVRLENVTVAGGNAAEGYNLSHAFDRDTHISALVGHLNIPQMVETDGEKAPVYDVEGFLFTPGTSRTGVRAGADQLYISSVTVKAEGYILPTAKLSINGEETEDLSELEIESKIALGVEDVMADKVVIFYTKDGVDPQEYLAAGVVPVADPAICSTVEFVDNLDQAANETSDTPAEPYSPDYFTHNQDWENWDQYAVGKVFYYIANGTDDETQFYVAPRNLWNTDFCKSLNLKAITVLMPQDVEESKVVHFGHELTLNAQTFEAPATWENLYEAANVAETVRRAASEVVKTGHSDVLDLTMGFGTTGVENISVENAGDAEYYDLRGIHRGNDANALTPGVYLRRTATGTSKVVIK